MKSIKTYTSAKDALNEIFGYEDFREPQDVIIENVASGNDGLVVLATGNGKSLCYQIPSLMSEGMTVVVTPLISLMKDQVDTLIRKGVPSVSLYGEQDYSDKQAAVNALNNDNVKLLYVSPEKLLDEDFQKYLSTKNIARFAIDEAHCVSIWGRDFRSSYTRLGDVIDKIGELKGKRIQRFAYTATANEDTRKDIKKMLHMQDDAYELVGSFDRPNINFYVRPTKNKMESIMDYILQHPNEPTIVYSATIKQAEKMVDYLNLQGIPTGLYHGRMKPETKNQVQDAFMKDELSVIVATNAFGMGVDKSNVRHVLHLHMPGNIENFYQEAGRAGRDGSESNSVIFYSDKDMNLQNFFTGANYPEKEVVKKIQDVLKALDSNEPFNMDAQVLADYASMDIKQNVKVSGALKILADNGMISMENELGKDVYRIEINGEKIHEDLNLDFLEERRRHATSRINQMVRYCVSKVCRKEYLLAALGDQRTHKNCGRCDNCQRELEIKNKSDQRIAEEVITNVLSLTKILSDTSINHESMISKVLLGTNSATVKYGRANGVKLMDLDQFGALKNWRINEVASLIAICAENGFIDVSKDANGSGSVKITESGNQWLETDNKPIVKATKALKDKSIGVRPDEKSAHQVKLSGVNADKVNTLKQWRREKAKEMSKQELMLISDDQIDALSKLHGNITKNDLIKAGMPPRRVTLFGDDLVSVLNKKQLRLDTTSDLGL